MTAEQVIEELRIIKEVADRGGTRTQQEALDIAISYISANEDDLNEAIEGADA